MLLLESVVGLKAFARPALHYTAFALFAVVHELFIDAAQAYILC